MAVRPGHGASRVSAIDLFCGAGGLSYGLKEAGVLVTAGIDIDPSCAFPFQRNIEASFLEMDIRDVKASHLRPLWPAGTIRLLAGCAPCQPFSSHRRGADTSTEDEWKLLLEFGRLVASTKPELVTMENVVRLGSTTVFGDFVDGLCDTGYHVTWQACYGPDYGLAQSRRRLVLLASRLGPIEPPAVQDSDRKPTVRDVIGGLPPLASGGKDPDDPIHTTRELTKVNLERIRASVPGGTWKDWPKELRAPCHQKASGASFRSVYARMEWDKPAPTITTEAHNFGTGRFGHPDQDRAISLREAAMLQGFPRGYDFVRETEPIYFTKLGRLIGNAVPPPLGKAVGDALQAHVSEYCSAN